MAQRWKAKPKGFATVKRDGWWVKPGNPAGGKVATTTRSSLPPRDWVGSAGMIGSWKGEPRLNPDQYEWMQSPETKKWWARPRTELTGLDHGQRADIAAFDAQTTAQTGRINQSFDQFVKDSQANQAAGAASLQGLAGLMGSGQAGADPTGKVLSQAAREQSVAGVAPIVANLSRMPDVARSEGLSAVDSFTADRLGQRQEALSGFRQTNMEAAAAESKLAADMRGQELEHLGRLAGHETDLARTRLTEKGKSQDRAARLATEAAKLRNQAEIARQNNNTKLAIQYDKRAQAKETAAKKAKKAPTANDIRQWAKRARAMWDGIPRKVQGPDGKSVTEYLQYDYAEIVRELQAMGAPKARATKIARQITGRGGGTGATAPTTSMFGW